MIKAKEIVVLFRQELLVNVSFLAPEKDQEGLKIFQFQILDYSVLVLVKEEIRDKSYVPFQTSIATNEQNWRVLCLCLVYFR